MNRPRHSHPGLYVAPLVAVLTLAAPTAEAAKSTGLYRAQTCSAVRSRLIDLLTDQAMRRRPYRRHWRHRGIRRRPSKPMTKSGRRRRSSADAAPRSAPPSAAAEASRAPSLAGGMAKKGKASGPSHFTGTNNQVDGVDEADRVKTDGRYIYTLYGREVLVLKSWPVRATTVVGRYRVKNGFTPRSLFLKGNQLMVLSNGYHRRVTRGKRPTWWSGAHARFTRITLLDISGRRTPRAMAAAEIEGNMLQARLIGSNAFIVSNDPVNLPSGFWQSVWRQVPRSHPNFRPWGSAPQTQLSMRDRVRRALANVSMQDLLPSISFFNGRGRRISTRSLHRCNDLYIPNGPARLGLLSLTKLSFTGGRISTAGVMAGGQKIYASLRSLYVSTTAHRWKWSRRWGYKGTQIHKFSLAGGTPRYAASGVVDGYLLNQFSMDEHRGYLRVATTSRGWGWRGGSRAGNNLFVLGHSGRRLYVAGQVRGLAPGERIYAARMMGDKGYIVTFRRTDPLYTLDLRNPREPKVMGELKINGFSSYIHPLGPGQLLTVGQDADASGRVKGAHLQIFDVRNLKQPRRTHHYLLTEGYRSSSSAQYNHHAFTFDARSGTLALPLNVSSGKRWTGIVLVKVDARRGFNYLGTVDHQDMNAHLRRGPVNYRCPPGARCRMPRRYNYRPWIPIQRSLFIDRYVYTLSTIGLKAHDLGQGKPRQVVALRFDRRQMKRPQKGTRPWH